MRATVAWMMCLCLSTLAGACGFLDDDLALSDEAFEASMGVSGGVGYGRVHSSSCGGGYGSRAHSSHSHHHHTIGTLGTGKAGPNVIDMDPSHISASRGASTAVGTRQVAREEDEEQSDSPIYAAGELETWGDYLEAELQRAQ